jgi:arylformamidase
LLPIKPVASLWWKRQVSTVDDWQTLGAAELERQYSPSSAIGGDYQPYIAQYLQRSADARAWFAAHQASTVRYDLPYGSQPSQRFDLFLPVSQHLPPLVVFIHGGYWQELSKNESHFAAIHAVQAGLAHVVLDYTLAPNATVAEIVDECVMALRHLRANAAELGFDGHRICIAGSSAGAHLATMTALQCPFVQAAILVSGIYQLGPLVHTSMNQALGLTAASAQALSPLRLDVSAFPPSVIAWAELETPQFKLQSQAFAKRVGQDNVLEIPFRNHFDVILDVLNPATELGQGSLKLIHRFLKTR